MAYSNQIIKPKTKTKQNQNLYKSSQRKRHIIFKRANESLIPGFLTEVKKIRKQLKNVHKILKC